MCGGLVLFRSRPRHSVAERLAELCSSRIYFGASRSGIFMMIKSAPSLYR